jgi:hypothetical protein
MNSDRLATAFYLWNCDNSTIGAEINSWLEDQGFDSDHCSECEEKIGEISKVYLDLVSIIEI